MNSLFDLNSQTVTVEYGDFRPAGVEFNTTTPVNQTKNVLEGQTYTASVGINIIDVVDYATTAVSYTVNVSAQPGATVTWNVIPLGCSVSNPSTGVYRIDGINSAFIWEQVKNPIITPDIDFYGTWTITSTINYLSTLSKSWTTTVNVTNVVELSTPSEFWFVTGSNLLTGNSTMLDTANPLSSWQVFVSVSPTVAVSTMSTAGSGGTSSFNNTTKLLTITGTNAQINSHLNSLTFVTNGVVEQDLVFTYTAQKISTLEVDTQTQNVRCALIRYLSSLTDFNYNEDTSKLITGAPLVTDLYATGTPSYTVTVTPTTTSAVRTMSSAGAGGSSSFNTSTKRLTLVGTKTQVNSHLAAITLIPESDYTSSFSLTYAVTPPVVLSPGTLTKNQQAIIDQVHGEVSNITLARDYINGQTNSIFSANTPQITDLDTLATSYTIGLTVPESVGTFSAPGTTTSRTWTYTGTKTQVNALFSQITFTPATNYFQNITMTYTQSKLSPGVINQVNQAALLVGPDIAYDAASATNQTATAVEGATFSVPVGINVIGVKDFATTLPFYTIDVSNCAGATVTWPTIPAGSAVTNPSTGVYRISGLTGSTVWNQIKNPTVNLPNGFSGTFSFTATVACSNPASTKSWSVSATISDVYPLTTTTTFNYYSGSTQVITGAPQIVDEGNQIPSWTLVASLSRTNTAVSMASSGSGVTGTWNNSLKTLTIVGTKAQVNANLSNISLSSPTGIDLDYTVTYSLSNNLNAETGIRTQSLVSNNYTILDATRAIETYTLNTVTDISGGPLITNLSYGGTADYTMTVKANPTAAITLMTYNANTGRTYNLQSSSLLAATTTTFEAGLDTYFHSVSLSSDGSTLLVGQPTEGGATYNLGRAYFYVRNSSQVWSFQQIVDIDFEGTATGGNLFGNSVALSANGNTAYIFGRINHPAPNSSRQGKIYVYTRSGTTWTLQQSIFIPAENFQSRSKIVISSDNTKLFIGGDSSVFVYNISGSTYTLAQTITLTGTGNLIPDGMAVSSDNSILAIGLAGATFVVNDDRGKVAIWSLSGGTYSFQTDIFPNQVQSSGPAFDFGRTLGLSSDGTTLVVGAAYTFNSSVYSRSGSTWTKVTNFGGPYVSVAISNDGLTIALSNILSSSIVIYSKINGTWTFATSLNATGTGSLYIGRGIAMSGNGSYLVGIGMAQNVGNYVWAWRSDAFPTWNASLSQLEMTGSKTGLNSFIDQLQITPSTGYASNFELIYSVVTPTATTSQRNQNVNKI
jgi:hypothetical protein